jgi:fibronectin type 3 domain-containing protein
VSGTGRHAVRLSWTASTSTGVTSYNLFRSTTSGGPYTKLNRFLVGKTSYTDWAVEAGHTYYYVTTAVNQHGIQSRYSNQASARVP